MSGLEAASLRGCRYLIHENMNRAKGCVIDFELPKRTHEPEGEWILPSRDEFGWGVVGWSVWSLTGYVESPRAHYQYSYWNTTQTQLQMEDHDA